MYVLFVDVRGAQMREKMAGDAQPAKLAAVCRSCADACRAMAGTAA
jgi:hypothetical protein